MYYYKKIKSTILICFLLAAFSCHVTASEQSRGRVNMHGSIIDTACSITMDDRYQTVQITTQPVAMVIQPAEKISVSFHINLESCSLHSDGPPPKQWSHFQVTFDGSSDDGKLFNVMGEAKGIALEISDHNGNIAIPGKALPAGMLSPGLMALNYQLHLKGNGQEIRPGDYYSIIRFKVDYF